MNKLVKKFVSLVLTVESFSLIGLSVKGMSDDNSIYTYVKINRQEKKSGNPIPLYRNENNDLVDIFGTVLRYEGKVLRVPESLFNEFPRWDESKSPLSGRRSGEKILKVLSKSLGPCWGRNEKNELISIKDGQKVRNMNHTIIVTAKYYANFPVISVDMSKELYEYLDSPSVDAIKSHQVYRNKYNRLVDEFGNGLKYDGKFISVPPKYRSKIQEHPWEEGVRKGEVFLDSCGDLGTKVFKVVNKDKDLITPGLSILYKYCEYSDKLKETDCYCERPNCIDIPLLDKSEENMNKFNESLNYEHHNLYDSCTSRDILDFKRKHSKSHEISDNQENKQSYDEHYDKQLTTVKDSNFPWGKTFLIVAPTLWLLNRYAGQLDIEQLDLD